MTRFDSAASAPRTFKTNSYENCNFIPEVNARRANIAVSRLKERPMAVLRPQRLPHNHILIHIHMSVWKLRSTALSCHNAIATSIERHYHCGHVNVYMRACVSAWYATCTRMHICTVIVCIDNSIYSIRQLADRQSKSTPLHALGCVLVCVCVFFNLESCIIKLKERK